MKLPLLVAAVDVALVFVPASRSLSYEDAVSATVGTSIIHMLDFDETKMAPADLYDSERLAKQVSRSSSEGRVIVLNRDAWSKAGHSPLSNFALTRWPPSLMIEELSIDLPCYRQYRLQKSRPSHSRERETDWYIGMPSMNSMSLPK